MVLYAKSESRRQRPQLFSTTTTRVTVGFIRGRARETHSTAVLRFRSAECVVVLGRGRVVSADS